MTDRMGRLGKAVDWYLEDASGKGMVWIWT